MPSVLVTGASRGMGNSIATHLAGNGWDVFAGVRSEGDAAKVTSASPRITPVILDITNAEHLAALDDSLPERLNAVVNNAAVVVAGSMESIAPAQLRRELEVNVVGQLAVTQAVLARLRRLRGRIVFISSVIGRVSFPLLGAYCASKFALEAVADALRMELKPSYVPVVVVEPAQTRTDMWQTEDTSMQQTAAPVLAERGSITTGTRTARAHRYPGRAVPPAKVARVVEEALTARRPRARYVVGAIPRLQIALVTKLPTATRDRLLRAVSSQASRI